MFTVAPVNDAAPLVAAISMNPKQPMQIEVTLIRPLIVTNFGVVFDAINMLIGLLPKKAAPPSTSSTPSTPSAASTPSMESQFTGSTQSTAVTESAPPAETTAPPEKEQNPGMQIVARLETAGLIVPANLTNPNGGGFVLSFGVSTFVQMQGELLNVDAALSQLSLKAAMHTSVDKAAPVLEPCDIQVKLKTNPPTANTALYRNIQANLGIISLVYSYEVSCFCYYAAS